MDERTSGPTGGSPRVPQQVTRLLILFALFLVALLAARHYLIPPTFGDEGHYRAAAVPEIAARAVKYAGREACADCHPDVIETHSQGKHHFLGCETCHGPSAAHAANPTEVKPRVPRERDFCPRCHSYDPSRPTGFPQIDPVSHNPGNPCVACHMPHAPAPPTLPASCGACHGEIARTKAASPHAPVPCTRCHEVSDKHKDVPRANPPTKPTTREFCGECHAKGAHGSGLTAAEDARIPRIDMDSHGRRFLCWQCHYPHSPEVR
ncbi:MAG: multiheme c-type cytochrome [Bacteroidales bacterium]